MNDMAKVVRSGARQSVELPDGYGFDVDEVRISREGDRIVLEPEDVIDEETRLPLRRLRALIQQGLDSGQGERFDIGEIKRRGREQLAREG